MTGMKIGYARVSTSDQDLTGQRNALLARGVEEKQIFVDHGLTGSNRVRPGLREAMAACRAGDTLVVTKLDRLARSLSDARDIADELTAKGVVLSLGGSTHDPTDPVGRLASWVGSGGPPSARSLPATGGRAATEVRDAERRPGVLMEGSQGSPSVGHSFASFASSQNNGGRGDAGRSPKPPRPPAKQLDPRPHPYSFPAA